MFPGVDLDGRCAGLACGHDGHQGPPFLLLESAEREAVPVMRAETGQRRPPGTEPPATPAASVSRSQPLAHPGKTVRRPAQGGA